MRPWPSGLRSPRRRSLPKLGRVTSKPSGDLHECAYAKILASLLHTPDVLNGDAENFGETRLGPTLRGAKLGEPAPDVAHDLIGTSLAHASEGPRIGFEEKAFDLM
jgi:hypothetical protein